MPERGIQAMNRAPMVIDTPYFRERDERDYVLMLDGMWRNLDEGRTLCLAKLGY